MANYPSHADTSSPPPGYSSPPPQEPQTFYQQTPSQPQPAHTQPSEQFYEAPQTQPNQFYAAAVAEPDQPPKYYAQYPPTAHQNAFLPKSQQNTYILAQPPAELPRQQVVVATRNARTREEDCTCGFCLGFAAACCLCVVM